ncbi:MAG: hypothetical protein ACLRMJ_03735 [Alistipes finegoldii]
MARQRPEPAEIGGGLLRAAMYLSPHIDPQENYNPLWGNGQRINTPRATIDQNTYSIERTSLNHTAYLEVALAKGLKLRSQNSYYSFQRHTYRYYPGSLPAKNGVKAVRPTAQNSTNSAFEREHPQLSSKPKAATTSTRWPVSPPTATRATTSR